MFFQQYEARTSSMRQSYDLCIHRRFLFSLVDHWHSKQSTFERIAMDRLVAGYSRNSLSTNVSRTLQKIGNYILFGHRNRTFNRHYHDWCMYIFLYLQIRLCYSLFFIFFKDYYCCHTVVIHIIHFTLYLYIFFLSWKTISKIFRLHLSILNLWFFSFFDLFDNVYLSF